MAISIPLTLILLLLRLRLLLGRPNDEVWALVRALDDDVRTARKKQSLILLTSDPAELRGGKNGEFVDLDHVSLGGAGSDGGRTAAHRSTPQLVREVRQKKLDMSVDQLLVYLQAVELAPKFIKQADLDDAVRCATAGNQLLHGASPSNLNFAQFLEVLGSLAINCFSPERRDEEDEKTFSWSAPLKRLEFVLSHVEGI